MSRRVAIISDVASYVGPDLARLLAARGHDIVTMEASDELRAELEAAGAQVVNVPGRGDLTDPEQSTALVAAAVERFGGIDSATAFTGRIVVGRFLRSTLDELRTTTAGCIEAPYNFMKAVVPQMIEQDDGGQVLVVTSAAGARPTPGAPLYSAARAGANMLVKNVAAEVASKNVQVNAVGTNFMDFPGFLAANRVTDEESRAKVEAMVPMKRLGTMEEFAHFCAVFVDGTSRFTTGQFIPYAGGWA
jgi:NAD(P)-dependent dehydrogenase (short-subunit alcohol dehydrogenase family)